MNTWSELLQRANLPPAQDAVVRQHIATAAANPDDPVWLKALAAVAGWIASFFLGLFFGLFNVYANEISMGVFGIFQLVLGIVLMRSSKVLFLNHLALALCLLGTGMLVGSVTGWNSDFAFGRLLLVQALVAAVGYVLVPSSAYRFLVCVNTAFLMVCWLVTRHNYAWMPLWMVTLAIATGVLWAWRARPPMLNALAYATAFSLAGTVLFDLFVGQFRWWDVDMIHPRWTSIPIAVVFLAVIAAFTSGLKAFERPWMWGACVLAALVGISGESGIMIGLLLLVISFAWDDRLLAVFAYLFLGHFLFMYYYSLQVPLSAKSWIVGGTGVLLLLLRYILHLLDKKEGGASS